MLLLQLTIDGLASGALYALTAVGFAIIYNGTRILHMAHGAVFTFGGYAFYICVQKLGAPLPVAVIVALHQRFARDVIVTRNFGRIEFDVVSAARSRVRATTAHALDDGVKRHESLHCGR